jgi:nucleoid DNA-binding protein
VNNKNKTVVTKESLINIISDKCKDDYISTEDLLELINKATDEDGIISKKRLIKSVKGYHTKSVVKDVYGLLENVIFKSLRSVNEEQDVCIRLFEGVSLDGVYVPEQTKKNNLTGEMRLVESKIKPKFNITRSYCEKLNSKRHNSF